MHSPPSTRQERRRSCSSCFPSSYKLYFLGHVLRECNEDLANKDVLEFGVWLRANPVFGKKSSSAKNSEASDHSSSSQSISKSPFIKMTSHVSPESDVPDKGGLFVHNVLALLVL